MARPVVGAQLYTVREFCRDEEGIASTLRKVAALGYTTVQVSGFGPVAPETVARLAAEAGLRIVATHVKWDRFLNELDAVIAEHHLWQCPHAAIGSLTADYHSLEGLDRFLRELEPVAAGLAAAGLSFSYHNHNHELARFEGRTWLERLYDGAPARWLKAEIDTYWIQAGGGSPEAWVKRCAGREPLLHLKDMAVTPDRNQVMAPIGQGNLDWAGILRAAEAGGVEFVLVEQDDCQGQDPFEALGQSYEYLKGMGYA